MGVIPDFFKNRNKYWTFEDVLDFINEHFEVKKIFYFRVGDRENNPDENQRAGTVLAYAKLMNYSLNQIKALFGEHDHFAIAMPKTRQGRNILEINKIFYKLLQNGKSSTITLNEASEFFDIPDNILTIKM